LFLNWDSSCSDQSLAEETILDVTAISTPLDSVPLYRKQSDKEPTTLLKSSQAASSSARLREGTPAMGNSLYEYRDQNTRGFK